MGWYGGAGARRVFELRGVPGGLRPIPEPRPVDGLIECRWPVSFRIETHPDWLSGVYLVRLTGIRDGKQAFVPFVLRERPGAARRAPLLVPCSVNTWQAYNSWGGKSLYDFNSFGGRAHRVSFDRPYAASRGAGRGAGAGELLTVDHALRARGWEYPFLRWLERNGYDVGYTTNVDIHRDRSAAFRRKALLLVGHDEYWSSSMRDHVEAARDRGIHLGIFGSNVCYWQVRFEPSSGRVADRVLFCAKEPDLDPVYNTERDRDLTVRFRNLHPPRPELSLVGMMMGSENAQGDFTPVPEALRHWVYQGTGFASGRARSVPGVMGYEVDRSFIRDRTWGRWSPPGLTVLSRTWIKTEKGDRIPAETTVYTAPSGAVVFAAGSMQWSWGLDEWGESGPRPVRRHPDLERVTKNVLGRYLGSGRAPDRRSPG